MQDNESVYDGSGNVFEDLGLPDADLRLAKAELARFIRKLIAARGLTQGAAAKLLGIKQPDVSDLVRGRLARFSLERLGGFLPPLGMDVTIRVEPHTATTAARLHTELVGI
jgi:predicted XRE-type DNA-binding protein